MSESLTPAADTSEDARYRRYRTVLDQELGPFPDHLTLVKKAHGDRRVPNRNRYVRVDGGHGGLGIAHPSRVQQFARFVLEGEGATVEIEVTDEDADRICERLTRAKLHEVGGDD